MHLQSKYVEEWRYKKLVVDYSLTKNCLLVNYFSEVVNSFS